MQISEFIEATSRLEQYYGKEFTDEQRQIMFDELRDFSAERYKKLLSKCLKTCKYMPKIADIFAANLELIGDNNREEERKIIPCEKCDGTGLVLYTKFINNGDVRIPYTYMARCVCENANFVSQKIPTYQELGIQVSNRINQVKDISRKIEDIKDNLIKHVKV